MTDTDELSWTDASGDAAAKITRRFHPTLGEVLDVEVATAAHDEALTRLTQTLRIVSSRERLAERGITTGFRWEDLLSIDIGPPDSALDWRTWLARRLPRSIVIGALPVGTHWQMRARFVRRGVLDHSQRRRYERVDGRVAVEAFELHVVEHCNLRCIHCCNMSPFMPSKLLSAVDIEAQCRLMAQHLKVDVFKIMGGEPLLHPHIADVLQAVRRSGISDVVRLFTNGLLLRRMDDAFWRSLDHLTISNYASASVPAATLALAAAKAAEFDIVLNIKNVTEFTEVMRVRREPDDATVRATYDSCWLRHRCLVVRRGRFYKCTRAAYAEDFHHQLLHDAYPDDKAAAVTDDGVSVDVPQFGEAILHYLNRTQPLASCRFCHGGDGPAVPHRQLPRADMRAGRLTPIGEE